MRRFRTLRRYGSNGLSKVKKAASRARRSASAHRSKAKTFSLIALGLGGFIAYEKFIKKS